MSRQIPEVEGHEKLVANRLGRDTRHSCHDKNNTAEENLCQDIIEVCRNMIQEQA